MMARSGLTSLDAASSSLPTSVVKNLADKLYDKRKLAALEIEQLVKRLAQEGNVQRINDLIEALNQYALSSQSNARKGGLLGLAATAVGLAAAPGAPAVPDALPRIVPPILNSFTDADSRVRYYAAEALYNVAKSLRDVFMGVFADCFEALFRICSDPDPGVQSAATFLDRLIKDIVAESHSLDLGRFLPLLEQYLTVGDPYKRQFLLSWLGLLDSLPDITLVQYLPRLLPGLLSLLSDDNPEIRQGANKLLQELLVEVHTSPPGAVDLPTLADVLAAQLPPHPPSTAAAARAEARQPDVAVQLTALRWLHELIPLGGEGLAPRYATLLRAVLPCLAQPSSEIAQAARLVNESLLARCRGVGEGEGDDAAGAVDGSPPPPPPPPAWTPRPCCARCGCGWRGRGRWPSWRRCDGCMRCWAWLRGRTSWATRRCCARCAGRCRHPPIGSSRRRWGCWHGWARTRSTSSPPCAAC